jgi:hypothetical protein
MFICRNQPCGAQWQPSEVEVRNEGQGTMFRCPLCGTRNYVESVKAEDGTVAYKQPRA